MLQPPHTWQPLSMCRQNSVRGGIQYHLCSIYPGECTKDLLHKGQVERLHASSAINSVVHKTCGTLTGLLCNVTSDFKFEIHPITC